MQGNALVSIIIPAYNTAPYVFRAIESSLRQTHSNIEVLVIDDGSTDDTLRVAEAFAAKDKMVRVFHQENAGVSVARNLGIHEARGEYLMFLDSDDWLEDYAVEILLAAQLKYPDRLIGGDFCDIDESGSKQQKDSGDMDSISYSINDIAEFYCGIGKGRGGFHSACAKIYSAELIAGSIEFPEGISHSEDAVFVMKYLHRTNGALFLNRPVYIVLERSGSAIRSSYKPSMLKSQLDAYSIMINLPENTPEIKTLMKISMVHYIQMYLDDGIENKRDGIGATEIAQMREAIKPYVRDFLGCRKLSVRRKVRFLFDMLVPFSLGRLIAWVYYTLKATLKKGR